MLEIDAKLLLVFDTIYRTKNLSKTAIALNVSQPAISLSLDKLRKHFSDQLFVRVGNKMEPTEIAKDLSGFIEEALEKVRYVNQYRLEFNPLISTREFTISMTDISHLHLLPTLVQHLKIHAPNVRLNIEPISTHTPLLMQKGVIDLAIGLIPQLDAGFYQQTLFSQHYVALLSQNHPRITRDQLSSKEYQSEYHIDVMPNGTGHYIVENELRKLGISRRIKISLPSYLGLGLILQDTDLIATIPNRLSTLLNTSSNLKILPLPYKFPNYHIKQHWHEKAHNNPDNQWLRKVIFMLFSQDKVL